MFAHRAEKEAAETQRQEEKRRKKEEAQARAEETRRLKEEAKTKAEEAKRLHALGFEDKQQLHKSRNLMEVGGWLSVVLLVCVHQDKQCCLLAHHAAHHTDLFQAAQAQHANPVSHCQRGSIG